MAEKGQHLSITLCFPPTSNLVLERKRDVETRTNVKDSESLNVGSEQHEEESHRKGTWLVRARFG